MIQKKFSKDDNTVQPYVLNEKSDVYSDVMLLWEISSGLPPFYVKGERYNIDFVIEISQGLKETTIPGTPEDYVKVYTGKYIIKNNHDNIL